MKVTLLTQNLQKKLSFLNHAVSNKTQLPILLNILLETHNGKLKIHATDLEIGIETSIPATITEEGAITVPARTFTELIASLPDDEVTLQTNEETLEVLSKRTKSVFQTTAKEEFPALYQEKGEKIATLPEEEIKRDFSSVVFAASTDTTRPALSGVLVRKEAEGFLLVATDGYRLSLKHYKVTSNTGGEDDHSFIVPARVFKELLSINEEESTIAMYVSQGSNQILFEKGETTLVGRLIEAEFPAFEKIIPSDFSVSVAFDSEEMYKAVKICSIFARDAANIIKFSFQKDHIIVSSSSSSVGENTVKVDAKLSGEENEIAFNARYLLDLFANIEGKEMVFEMTGPLNAGVFKLKDDNSFLHLIMPIRVQG
ncbi:MAG TPA: DNA polymerase III subunit beta [Patescibacteria group bacterium]|nr:DNA polymerase III subunit beta [Patescibacteria group bacterium]